jgi:hypothetical protein
VVANPGIIVTAVVMVVVDVVVIHLNTY